MKTTRRRRGILVIAFAIVMYAMVAFFQWLNTPAVQHRLAAWVSRHTSWDITLDRLEWRLLANTVIVRNLALVHRSTGHQMHADQIVIRYNLWTLPMGRLTIRHLWLDGVSGDLSHMPPPRTTRTPIDFKKLLLIKNLAVDEAVVNGVVMRLPRDTVLLAHTVRLQFKRAILKDVKLTIHVDGTQLNRGETNIATVNQLTLSGTSNVNEWVDTPPFINAVKGALTVTGAAWRALQVHSLTGVMGFDHSRFDLTNLQATVNEHHCEGKGHIDLEKEEFAVEMVWPEPMQLPELFGPNRFIDTAGTIVGKLAVKGKGFDPATSVGEGQIDLTHRAAAHTDIPARLEAKLTWAKGSAALKEGTLAVGDGRIGLTGGLQWPAQRAQLQFRGDRVPLDGVLGRFTDHHFHPFRGTATVTGTFSGWARNFSLDLTAEGTPTSYYDIVAERARIQMRLTYGKLDLHGTIAQGGHDTGQAQIAIAYGPKQEGQPRPKQMTVTARLDGHQLGPSFAAYYLTGTGKGDLTLRGSPSKYQATGQADITDGTFYALPLKHVHSRITIVPRLVTFLDGQIELPKTPPILLTQPLKMPITDDGIALQGTPRPGLTIDAAYLISAKRWTIRQIVHADPNHPGQRVAITGSEAGDRWDIGVRGTTDLSWLEYIPVAVREATGPLVLDLRLQGALSAPAVTGTAQFREAGLLLRNLPYHLEALQGTLRFQGHSVQFDPITARLGDGILRASGSVQHQGLKLTAHDVRLRGSAVHFSTEDRHFRAELDGDVTWRGDPNRSQLAGDVTIIDAKYDREFRVLEQMGRGEAALARAELRQVAEGWDRIGLNLRVRSSGDVWIRNNAADALLRVDAALGGTWAHPQMRGAVEAIEGKLHYLGLHFDITHGLMEFHAPFAHPYIEMTGEEEIREYLVQITLRGPVDNLALDLTATPGLERKDILALLAFGATQEELRTAQFGAQIGPSVVLEQIGKIVERPLSKLTGLDVVRVETQTGRGIGPEGSRLYLGKRLSDRLAVEFVTGVNEQRSEQGFQIEYNLTDWLLLKAAQQTGERARFDMSVRFRER